MYCSILHTDSRRMGSKVTKGHPTHQRSASAHPVVTCTMCGQVHSSPWPALVKIHQATAEQRPIMSFYCGNAYLTPYVGQRSDTGQCHMTCMGKSFHHPTPSLVTIHQATAELCPIMSFYSENAYLTPICRSKVTRRSTSNDICRRVHSSSWPTLVKIHHTKVNLCVIMSRVKIS